MPGVFISKLSPTCSCTRTCISAPDVVSHELLRHDSFAVPVNVTSVSAGYVLDLVFGIYQRSAAHQKEEKKSGDARGVAAV